MRWIFASDRASDALTQRHAVVAFLRERGETSADYNAAEVVFGELVGNVVRHASGPIAIEVAWGALVPVLHVRDRGPGFTYAGPRLSSPDDEGGRGIFLVAAFVDDLRVAPNPGGGSWVSATLRIRLARDGLAAAGHRVVL